MKHKCSNCGKDFARPRIDRANYICPHCFYPYTDAEYEQAWKRSLKDKEEMRPPKTRLVQRRGRGTSWSLRSKHLSPIVARIEASKYHKRGLEANVYVWVNKQSEKKTRWYCVYTEPLTIKKKK